MSSASTGCFSSRCEFHLSTSIQRVKHWLNVSASTYGNAFGIILLVSYRVQSVILALFFDWEIYFTPKQKFLHQNYTHSPYENESLSENGVKI